MASLGYNKTITRVRALVTREAMNDDVELRRSSTDEDVNNAVRLSVSAGQTRSTHLAVATSLLPLGALGLPPTPVACLHHRTAARALASTTSSVISLARLGSHRSLPVVTSPQP
jgi:hypothetical protein